MKPLTQYGRMAEKHWREFCPNMVAEMEATGRLQEMLLEAEEKTEAEMDGLRRHLIQQGLTPQQAHDRAWEIVRERYLWVAENPSQPKEQLGREHGSVAARELFRYSRAIQRGDNCHRTIWSGHGRDAALITRRLVLTLV